MNDRSQNRLREISWRRKLTEAEEVELRAWLAAHPNEGEDWESEAALSQMLDDLPEAPPVSTNFTALVLQAVELESAAQSRARPWWRRVPVIRWARLATLASLCVVLGMVTYRNYETRRERRAEADRLITAYQIAVVANPDVARDFDAIRRLDEQQPSADAELLALLQ